MGRKRRSAARSTARAAGIAVIQQHPLLFPDLDVAENVYMGRQPKTRFGRIDWREMNREVDALLRPLGVSFTATTPVRGLSVADQQMVEIAKALSLDARVLIMDEPTASLSAREVERLFAIVRRLREQGVAILFVSHRLDEVAALVGPRHDFPGRRVCHHRADQRAFDRSDHPAHGRPPARFALPEGGCRDRRGRALGA